MAMAWPSTCGDRATQRRRCAGWLLSVVGGSLIGGLLSHALLAQGTPPAGEAASAEAAARAEPSGAAAPAELPDELPLTEADRAHWAFAPLVRPPLPPVPPEADVRSGVDAFLEHQLRAQGLTPLGEAPRAVLLRRLTLDLLGLPPTPEELAAFEADRSPDAYERQVDRLLASPAVGERWAQMWLDLARFAQTDGFEHDKVRAEAWKYRDWVIAALNADLPYDQFVRWQLAGDELGGQPPGLPLASAAAPAAQASSEDKAAGTRVLVSPPVPAAAVPTMFCLAGPDMPDLNDQDERRHNLLNELTATVGSVLLGLQLGCAQCHDHKYDPLSMGDFYRLRAVFEPAVPLLKRDVGQPHLAAGSSDTSPRVWVRGDHRRPGPTVSPGFPRIASPPTVRWQPPADRSPRQALVDWLFAPGHPLTGRVIANRLWAWHFGQGLCHTPSDFGVMGGPLNHPELLDWLACELAHRGWSLKQLHRLLVTSAVYRRASQGPLVRTDGRPAEVDEAGYARFPRQRLTGETIRDALLAVSGLLVHESGGTGVMPPLPAEMVSTLLKGQWTTSPRVADHYRRSIYLFARRNLRYPLFEAFDRPDANVSCPLRGRSTTAPQALLLLNSELSLTAAQHLAGRVLAEAAPADQAAPTDQMEEGGLPGWKPKIRRLYQIVFARLPEADEAAMIERFLVRQAQTLRAEGRNAESLVLPQPCPAGLASAEAAAWVDLCLALLNSNEFIYVD